MEEVAAVAATLCWWSPLRSSTGGGGDRATRSPTPGSPRGWEGASHCGASDPAPPQCTMAAVASAGPGDGAAPVEPLDAGSGGGHAARSFAWVRRGESGLGREEEEEEGGRRAAATMRVPAMVTRAAASF